jgi:hypothetical protein
MHLNINRKYGLEDLGERTVEISLNPNRMFNLRNELVHHLLIIFCGFWNGMS